MGPVRRYGRSALLALLLLPLTGCFGGAHNPSVFPYWFPAGDAVQTHAKPAGRGYFANFDPKAVRLEVRPLRSTNPVRTQHLLIATVLDEDGNARRKRRVEWMLEGVGSIIEVDESGWLNGRGMKVDNRYAYSYTDYFEHTVTRGNDDPSDDFVIRPGQTWCIVTSPIEGETRMTIYAPEIYNWEKRTQTVSLYWADCEWQFPAPATVRSGTPHTLTTRLFRHSDRSPVPNYRVRYTLKDGGPQAELLPNRGREITVASDSSGIASAGIQQLNLQPGINRIGIEVIRPANPGDPAGAPVILASQEITVDWQAPRISVKLDAPPAAALNQEIPATVTISNTGQVDTQAGQVYFQMPPGLSFVRSDPPARTENGYLVWDLASLGGGREQKVNLTLKAREKGAFPARVVAATRDSLRAEQGATLRIEPGELKVELVGPPVGIVGVPVDYQIKVTNPSAAEVSKVLVDVILPPDVVAITPGGTRFERKLHNDRIPPLKPNESRTLPLQFESSRIGMARVTAMVSAEGGLSAEQSVNIDFQQAQVEMKLSGPEQLNLGHEGSWSVVVRNAGSVPVTGASLRTRLPSGVTARNATNNGLYDNRTNEVTWTLGTLAAGEERIVRVVGVAARLDTQGKIASILTGSPNVEQKAEQSLSVVGVPALRVDVTSSANPIDVGGQVTYTIRVMNQGTLPLDQVDIAASLTPLMRALGGRGTQQVTPRGNDVVFPPIRNLAPNQTATVQVFAQAIEGGDGRLRVTVQSPSLAQPVITEEATRILPRLAPPMR